MLADLIDNWEMDKVETNLSIQYAGMSTKKDEFGLVMMGNLYLGVLRTIDARGGNHWLRRRSQDRTREVLGYDVAYHK